MNTKLLFSLFVTLLLAQPYCAQSFNYDYFPEAFLKKEKVKSVSVYESWIEDQTAYSGFKNRIRLARNLSKETYFTEQGKKTRTLFFNPETETIRDYVIYSYNEKGQLLQWDYYYPESMDRENGSDENILTRHYVNSWLESGALDYRIISMGDFEEEELTDSITFAYDAKGRLREERQYTFDKEGPNSGVIKIHEHKGEKTTTIRSMVGEEVLSSEEIRRDDQGRVISAAFYAGKDKEARYKETYRYDPRGWLAETIYTYDWDHYKKAKSVISRQNKYDDHGKLVEVHLDYGNGRRQIKFIDYGYFTDN